MGIRHTVGFVFLISGKILENGFNKTCDLLSTFVLILALIKFSDLPGEAIDQEYEDSLCGEEYEF